MSRRLLATLMLAPMVLTACGQPAETDPAKLLNEAAAASKGVQTFLVDLKFTPGLRFQTGLLVTAKGKVRLPGDSYTQGTVQVGDSIIKPELISLGGKVYLRILSFTGYQQLSDSEAAQYPTVGRMLDPSTGMPSIIPRGRSPVIQGGESIDGTDCYKVSATYAPADLAQAFAPLSPVGDVQVVLWIAKDNHRVRQARLFGHLLSADQTNTIEVHVHGFNGPVDIPSPT